MRIRLENSLPQDESSPLEPLYLLWLWNAPKSAGITGTLGWITYTNFHWWSHIFPVVLAWVENLKFSFLWGVHIICLQVLVIQSCLSHLDSVWQKWAGCPWLHVERSTVQWAAAQSRRSPWSHTPQKDWAGCLGGTPLSQSLSQLSPLISTMCRWAKTSHSRSFNLMIPTFSHSNNQLMTFFFTLWRYFKGFNWFGLKPEDFIQNVQLMNHFLSVLCCMWNLKELEGLSSREVQRIQLPVTQGGELDALAVWFQLHLDEESSLSTGPQEDTCWEQAIYPVHSTKCKMLACWKKSE